jgi:hypothetical protein
MPCLPPHLESLIEAHSDAWNLPAAVHPKNKAECQRMVDAIDEFLQPTPKDFIVKELARLAAHFWSDRTEQQWLIVLQDYADDLHKYPATFICDVLKGWRLSEKWFPKEGELLTRLDAKMTALRLRRHRLWECLKAPDRPYVHNYYNDLSLEDKAKVDEALMSLGDAPRREIKHDAQDADFDQRFASSLSPEKAAVYWEARMGGLSSEAAVALTQASAA